jgi:predicted dehydrogenase/NADPH:quinone reductase-like Zn-dependent oxidoreductase
VKQILQNLKTGATVLTDIPCPSAKRGHLLIRTRQSLVSAGTERMLVEFGKGNWLDKARQQPDKVRQVLEKAKTDGVLPTLEAVRNKLDQALPMGYCNVGEVLEVGAGVSGFAVGDRVASNGKHAEVVSVPATLCAKIADEVTDETAAFTVLGAVALQGVRLAAPTLGEAVAVIGLGLVGLLAVQLLRAQGCRVLGMDFDPKRLQLARRFGAETVDLSAGADPLATASAFSRGRGMDAVLIAAATQSNDPIRQAARMSRQRGRIVLVGVTGLELSRADFYEKELTFQVSCAYGPGRYDPNYEEKGQDYPAGFVRWTAQRNFEAVLDLLADGRLDVEPLISHRFTIEEAEQAYAIVGGDALSLGILLRYPPAAEKPDAELRADTIPLRPRPAAKSPATVGFIGAGNYAQAQLIPAFQAAGVRLKTIASATGVSSVHAGQKFGFEAAITDTDALFTDPEIDALAIATRHNTHAALVCQALAAGKSVFVEKPLGLTLAELEQIETAYAAACAHGPTPLLMVGFNRRFAPHIVKMRSLLTGLNAPKAMVMTVNAGAIPASHWTQDLETGGGRIVGEACHFIDLLRHLAGSPIVGGQALRMGKSDDVASFTLSFADGSIGTVHYLANGPKSFPKERLEVFCGGRVLHLDNFRTLHGYGWPGFDKLRLWRQDKGQSACAAAFVQALASGSPSPIAFEELLETSRASVEIAQWLRA